MEMPPEDTPPEGYLEKSAYSVPRVAADKKAAGAEKALENCHAQLKQTLRAREDKEEVEQATSALLDAADGECDDVIESFELDLFGLVDKQRSDPRYQRYFKDGLRAVTTAEPRVEEPGLVAQMLKAMEEDKADAELGPIVAKFIPKLTAARDKVVLSDANLTAVEKELTFLDEKTILQLMANWRVEYKKLESALTSAYPTNPKKVARFFKPFRKSRRAKKAPSSPAAPTPVTPPANPPVT